MAYFPNALLACHGSLYRYARALTRDPMLAEDLVQETYTRALGAKKWPYPPTEEVLRPWLFTIARNHWINVTRSRPGGAMTEELNDEMADTTGDSPHSILARRLLQSEVRDAVDSLPAAWREVIVLREMENLSYEQIAGVVERPVGTVMSRLWRAREALRGALSQYAGTRSSSPGSRREESGR